MRDNERTPLGKILEDLKFATAKQVTDALQSQHETPHKKLGEILIEKKICSPVQISEALAKQFGLTFMRLDGIEVDPDIAHLVPEHICDHYKICPVRRNGSGITVALSDPFSLMLCVNLGKTLNTDIEWVLAPREDVVEVLEGIYGCRWIDPAWLKEKVSMTVDQLSEQSHIAFRKARPDLVGTECDKPGGLSHKHWMEFVRRYREGDEIWTFRSSERSWAQWAGRAGYALLRKGKVVAEYVTIFN